MNDANAPALPLGERRDRVVDLLCRHYAADHMTLEEFERRLDLAHRARDVAELDALLAGLPAVPAPAAAPVEPRPAIPARPERGTAIAIMGGSVRKGRWTPAAQTLALAGWGGVELDFREAQLPPGVTEVTAIAVMGGIEIVVPPGVVVESEGIAILGGFDHAQGAATTASPDAPVLRIRGLALLGGVAIHVREPHEPVHEHRKHRR